MTKPKDIEPEVLPPVTEEQVEAVEVAETEGKDYGNWKYQPWNGLDHWVNSETGATTFNLSDVR